MNQEARAQMEQQRNEAGEMRIQYHDEPVRGAHADYLDAGAAHWFVVILNAHLSGFVSLLFHLGSSLLVHGSLPLATNSLLQKWRAVWREYCCSQPHGLRGCGERK